MSVLPPMVDTHCHLDDRQFANDLFEVLENARRANVLQWVLIGYDPHRWDDVVELSRQHAGLSHSLGVHPAEAEQWTDTLATQLVDLARETGAVAIGEAGLDFYRDNAPLAVQERAFVGQLDIAADLDLPLVIHMRDAEEEVIRILSTAERLPTLIFHSFDGSARLRDFALDLGGYVGVGGLATRQSSEDLRALLAAVPMERLLLETDSPYLVPARQKIRRNEPAHIATIAGMMAQYLGTSPEELAAQTTANARHVFGLSND